MKNIKFAPTFDKVEPNKIRKMTEAEYKAFVAFQAPASDHWDSKWEWYWLGIEKSMIKKKPNGI